MSTDSSDLVITSNSNPWFKELKRLASSSSHYKQTDRVWLEGEHLIEAAFQKGLVPDALVACESLSRDAMPAWLKGHPIKVLSDSLFAQLSQLPAPAKLAAVIKRPVVTEINPQLPTVVLDRIQDAGNVGSVLRSAAAFGFTQVIALAGCAALWGGKVVRAGMGAHFSLKVLEDVRPHELGVLHALPWLATSSHSGHDLLIAHPPLPWPCVWLFGHEGQGLANHLFEQCDLKVRIHQPGGQESLNVAAAAAICLFASSLSH